MEVKVTWDEINVKENIDQTLVKILMLKGEKGDTGTTDYNELLNKPTKLSDFINDGVFITNTVNDLANYYTKSDTYTQAEINNLVSEIPKFAIAVVQQLPTEDISTTTIYLVPSNSEATDIYKEYIYVNNAWELLGIQKADLTNYYNKTEVDSLLSNKADSSTVSALSTQVGTNTSNISTLTSQVSTNTSDISSLNTTVSNKADSSTVSSLAEQVNINTDNISSLQSSVAGIVNVIYPVGAIYMSVNSTSPQTLFGGSWEQIQDRFLLAAGSTYSAGSTGGAASHYHTTADHTLTINEIPSHTHGYRDANDDSSTDIWCYTNSYRKGTINYVENTGGGQPHNHGNTGSSSNLPPYLSVYVWKRTA